MFAATATRYLFRFYSFLTIAFYGLRKAHMHTKLQAIRTLYFDVPLLRIIGHIANETTCNKINV